MPAINLDDSYAIRRAWAVAKPGKIQPYSELSRQYQARRNEWFAPHGSWGPYVRYMVEKE